VYLTVTLALTDWKLRFFGSVLGYVWSLLRPLLLFGILYLIFSEVVKVGAGIEHYPVVLLTGVVLYSYFAEVTGGAVSSVVDRESLVRKVTFPRMAIPLAVALVATLNLALNLVTVAVFMAISGVEPRWTWLLLPIPLIALVIFATGIALLVSALYVPFRDVRPIWDVILQALFYGTPILYPVEKLIEHSQTLATIAMCSPLAVVVEQFRFWLIGPSAPSAAEAIDGAVLLLIPLAILVGLTALGFIVFNRMAPHVAEEL
jgi:ABC-2 type transport system permease protein